jgi:hypothetical protein
MLSMQNSPFLTHLNGSGLQEACSGPDIPSLSGIDGSLRASTSSTSTGASPDDTSSDSPDWTGGSDRSNLEAMSALARSHDFMLDHDVDTIPKIEELDEDIQSFKQSDVGNGENDGAGAPVTVPRKRGRPRKHPLPAPGGQVKVTKGRSKTGCITCRRRKKKCDETKPA